MKKYWKLNKNRKTKHRSRRFIFILNITLIILIAIIIYGFYLDQKIRRRIDGSVWQLPVAVYGQIVNLEPDDAYSLNDIVSMLKGAQYRQVTQVKHPGEFAINEGSLEIYRRPFFFPDEEESTFRVRINFANDIIRRIYNVENGRDFGFFRIDPKLITMMSSPNSEQRLVLPLKNFPDSLIKILIETEDHRFYEHDGISFISIGRAIVSNFSSGKVLQGGSTLTQQLVKNLFLSNERSIIRKLREAYMAVLLEIRYSKERILELYLNEVYMGQNNDSEIHGFPLASLYYFGRPVEELTLDQQALLVGIVKGASYYNPWTRPARAIERRNVVLDIMKEHNVIDNEMYNLLVKRPLDVLPKSGVISPQPAFIQLVRQELHEKLGNKVDDLSGMKIFTTFDPVAQNTAEAVVLKQMKILRGQKNKPNMEVAMVVVNRLTGEVKAIVGSATPQYAGFNRALFARRQIGSLVKPATYLTALSDPSKYHLNTILDDTPLMVQTDNKTVWEPNNFDDRFKGDILLIDALAYSENIPSVRLGMELGFDETKKTLIALGVEADLIKPLPSRYVGALEMTPLEVSQMFQVIGNGGVRSDISVLRFIMDEYGHIIYQSYPNISKVVQSQAAYLTLYAMQQAIAYGSGRQLSAIFPTYYLAGKTGTTNDYRDSWFVGIDGRDVIVIWLGLDDDKPINLTGSRGALTLYREYLLRNTPKALIPVVPDDIVMTKINKDGELICNNKRAGKDDRILPFWSKDIKTLCKEFTFTKKRFIW